MKAMRTIIYECGICGSYHPWDWDGDCREDANRYPGPEEYAEQHGLNERDVEVMTWEERLEEDGWLPEGSEKETMRVERRMSLDELAQRMGPVATLGQAARMYGLLVPKYEGQKIEDIPEGEWLSMLNVSAEEPITKVVFRKFKGDGEIIALFPEIDEGNYKCSSYMHVGQHGGADYIKVVADTHPARPEEYQDLKQELESMGYNLQVMRRYSKR